MCPGVVGWEASLDLIDDVGACATGQADNERPWPSLWPRRCELSRGAAVGALWQSSSLISDSTAGLKSFYMEVLSREGLFFINLFN